MGLIALGLSAPTRAANFEMDLINGTTVTPAATGDTFTDSNPAGNYAINESFSATFSTGVIGEVIELQFTTLTIGTGDTLTIYNGPNASSPVLATLVSGSPLQTVASTGSQMHVVWTSNASGVAAGWSANIFRFSFRIAIANYNANTIVRFNPFGGGQTTLFTGAPLSNPNYMIGRPNGNFLVANGGDDDIEEYDIVGGSYVSTFITTTAGGLNFPEQMRYGHDGNLYIVSQANNLVQSFNPTTGALIGTFLDSADGLSAPLGLVVRSDGSYFVSNAVDGGQIRRYNSSGVFQDILFDYAAGLIPRGMTLDQAGNIYVIVKTSTGARIDLFTMPAGTQSTVVTLDAGSNPYNGIDFGPDGNLYIADFGEDEYHVYTSGGTLIRTITPGDGPHHAVFLPIAVSDFGDLPTGYPVTLTENGARHIIAGPRLGTNVDDDADGTPSTNADADDTSDSPDDEDGVTFPTMEAGTTVTVTVTASGAGRVNAFFDWNNDKDFTDPGETMTELVVVAGANNLSVPIPIGAVLNTPLGVRVRISTAGGLTATGGAADGEVEDYLVTVRARDFGDLPDTGAGTGTGNYRTLASDNGPRHTIVSGLNIGAPNVVDADVGTLQNAGATADDASNTGFADDEDGVSSFPTFTAGQSATVAVTVNNPTGGVGAARLYGFIDFNNDGDFGDTGEVTSVAVPDNTVGTVNLVFNVPTGASAGSNRGARFRLTTDTLTLDDTGAQGAASNGEVEDYVVTIVAGQDFGDLPDTGTGSGAGNYRTLLSDNGPRHTIVSGLNIGAPNVVDVDTGLLQNTGATADDASNTGSADDEDGVSSFPTFVAGQSATVTVTVNNPTGGVGAATLYGFIDWNNDGDFGDTGEATSVAVPDNTVGTVNLAFTVPSDAATGVNVGARFRLTTDTLTLNDAGAQGAASNGEVEDYVVSIVRRDYGDLPDTGAGTGAGNYRTLLTDNGPAHTIVSGLNIGAPNVVDHEAGTLQNAGATADDASNTGFADDEDGVSSFPTFTAGQSATVAVTVNNPTGGVGAATLYGFIDFNNDGDFGDTGEATSVAVPDNTVGTVNLVFNVPTGASVGSNRGARFRLTTDTLTLDDIGSKGVASNGEVEDYVVTIAAGQDFGDLPDTGAGTGTGNYRTLLSDNGPRHTIVTGLNIGAPNVVDVDTGLLQNTGATADDASNTGSADDEDGVASFPTFVAGQSATVAVTVNNPTGGVGAATLYGFIDFNGDGDFGDTGETASVAVPDNTVGTVNLVFNVPTGASVGSNRGARFRLTTDTLTLDDAGSQGVASNGEVEDYVVTIVAGQDFGDLPDTGTGSGAGNYRTLLSDNGPRHTIVTGLNIGAANVVDVDTGLLQNTGATADDTTNTGSADDEDGVASFPTFVAGQSATVAVTVNNPTGGVGAATLYGFIDWNNDGDFGDTGEATSVAVPDNTVGTVNLVFNVPTGASVGSNRGARFRLTTDTLTLDDAGSQGVASNGEVEDYVVTIVAGQDFGDLPDTGAGSAAGNYRTLLSDNGPRHTIVTGLNIGAANVVDVDTGLLQNTGATADDTSNTGSADDEDGVSSFPTFVAGQSATVAVTVNNPTGGVGAATLYGFIDWNNDGDFGDTGEATSVAVPDNTVGTVNLAFTVPSNAATGVNVGARFRLTTDTLTLNDAGAQGAASNGEVEDYVVSIVRRDYGDLPDTGAGTGAGNYRTLLTDNGPAHTIVSGLNIGAAGVVDHEAGTLQNAGATADDASNTGFADDEDGVASFPTFVAGLNSTVAVTVNNPAGGVGAATLYGFIDFNGDGDFNDTGEAASVAVPDGTVGTVNLVFSVPSSATAGSGRGARFRLTTDTLTLNDAGSQGVASNGEVEDYVISVVAPTVRLGNRVWLDNGAGGGTANDGLINGTEAGINGVTVQLFAADSFGNPTGSILAATTTATAGANAGYYSFGTLPGSYVVVIPPTMFASGQPLSGLFSSGTSTGTRNGVDPDTDPTDSDDNGYNAINPAATGVRAPAVTLAVGTEPTGEDNTNGLFSLADNSVNYTVDFGFVASPPTAVTLAYVKAFLERGQVVVEWETLSERNTVGFDVVRLMPDGSRVQVNASLVAARNDELGGVYRVVDPTTGPGVRRYELVETETTGRQIVYGPFTVDVTASAPVRGTRMTSEGAQFEFEGEPGAEYVIEAIEDLESGRWREVGRSRATEDGLVRWLESMGNLGSRRFFRALRN